jgi:LysM repeat protein
MARRSKSKHRREQQNDPLEALRPLIVLGLLGMILYGAYSIIQKGPKETNQEWQPPGVTHAATSDAPPFEPSITTPPLTTPPSVEVQTPPSAITSLPPNQIRPPSAPLGAQALVTDQPLSPGTEQMPPTYIDAVPAVPPQSQSPNDTAGLVRENMPEQKESAAFTAAWTDAHNKLEAGRYAEALAVLSVWYDNPSLSVEENHQLERILGQLAGTVIYSTQDMLLPPHTVAGGETLETIAKPLNIPWELLSKINGVASDELTTGQRIKVLRGPFDGVVSVSRRRISLQVGGRYAGTFPAAIGKGFVSRSGSSVKLLDIQNETKTQTAQTVPVGFRPAGRAAIILENGLSIRPANDPSFVMKTPEDNVLLVSSADFNDLAGILGQGSHLLVRE